MRALKPKYILLIGLLMLCMMITLVGMLLVYNKLSTVIHFPGVQGRLVDEKGHPLANLKITISALASNGVYESRELYSKQDGTFYLEAEHGSGLNMGKNFGVGMTTSIHVHTSSDKFRQFKTTARGPNSNDIDRAVFQFNDLVVSEIFIDRKWISGTR